MNDNKMSREDFVREELGMDERNQMINEKAASVSNTVGKIVMAVLVIIFFCLKQEAIVWMLFMIYFIENASSDIIKYKYYKTKEKLIYGILQIVLAVCACILMIGCFVEP